MAKTRLLDTHFLQKFDDSSFANAIVAMFGGANFCSKIFLIPRKVFEEPVTLLLNNAGLLSLV